MTIPNPSPNNNSVHLNVSQRNLLLFKVTEASHTKGVGEQNLVASDFYVMKNKQIQRVHQSDYGIWRSMQISDTDIGAAATLALRL